MSLESVSYVNDLDPANPAGGTDFKSEGDNHIRNLKTALRGSLPGLGGRIWRQITKSSGPFSLLETENLCFLRVIVSTTCIPSTATLGAGWVCLLWAQVEDLVVDPQGAETINGLQSVVLPAGSTGLLFSTAVFGQEFILVGLGPLKAAGGFPAVGGMPSRLVVTQDSGQLQFTSGALELQSLAGDVIASLHAVGSSAVSLRHPRGSNQLDIFNTIGQLTHLVIGSLQTTTANLTAAGDFTTAGGIATGAGIAANTGNITAAQGDLISHRAGAPGTGIVFLGNSGTRYLLFDGTNYVLPTNALIVGNNISSGADVIAADSLRSNGGVCFLNASLTRYLQFDGAQYVMPGAELVLNGVFVAKNTAAFQWELKNTVPVPNTWGLADTYGPGIYLLVLVEAGTRACVISHNDPAVGTFIWNGAASDNTVRFTQHINVSSGLGNMSIYKLAKSVS